MKLTKAEREMLIRIAKRESWRSRAGEVTRAELAVLRSLEKKGLITLN